jgi:thymidylate synthase
MSLKIINIEATTISDAWFQAVYKCLEIGQVFKIDQGSYEGDKRLEFDYITIHIKRPFDKPILPKLPQHYNLPDPVDENYINDYLPYLMTAEEKEGEAYTYGNRLCEVFYNKKEVKNNTDIYKQNSLEILPLTLDIQPINQINLLIEEYKKHGKRSNQRVLQIAQPDDCILKDPPCLRHIDTRIQNNKLHFFPYFRSWDLWGGFPANLQAIQYLKKYMANEIGVDDGEIICSSKGLHLYSYVWQLAEILRGKTIEEFRNE